MNTHYLMNVVHNDYKKPEAIFAPFLEAGEKVAKAHEAKQLAQPNGNGHANGSAH